MSARDVRDPQKLDSIMKTQPQESGSFNISKEIPHTPESPEVPKTAEKKEMKLEEPKNENIESTIQSLRQKLKISKKKKTIIPTVKDELTLRVEKIMEEGFTDAYKELTTVQQQEFKIKGEETAWKIRELFKRTHLKVKEIFKLLVEWLRMLPGVNKFFIEQEAKIKADKIISLKKHGNFE